jgi:hypothetical protein
MFDPDSTNPVDMLVKMALIIFFGLAAFFGNGGDVIMGDSQGSGAQPAKVLTVIESVEPVIRESAPPQISLNVSGYQPDGCTFPVLVDQTRDGNTITMTIYREIPPEVMCSMQLVPYNEAILLEGDFPPGEYTVDVNGTVVTLTV